MDAPRGRETRPGCRRIVSENPLSTNAAHDAAVRDRTFPEFKTQQISPRYNPRMKDAVFTMRSTPYKFGPGVTAEIGDDLVTLGLKRVLVVTDPGVAATGLPERAVGLIREKGIETGLFEGVTIEPTDVSVEAAIEFAQAFHADGYVAIGGGSVMD